MDCDAMRNEVFARGEIVENDTMVVDTGKLTGCCLKDRYIVDAGEAHDNVSWESINLPIQTSAFGRIFLLHCGETSYPACPASCIWLCLLCIDPQVTTKKTISKIKICIHLVPSITATLR